MSYEDAPARSLDFRDSLDFLSETPNKLADLIRQLTSMELRLKNSTDEFSALENICHLRDLEHQGYSIRIKRILEEDNPQLLDFDGARVAAESNYNDEEPGLALAAFQTTRLANVKKLQSATDQQLRREGSLEGVGQITLQCLTQMMREHDEGHLDDLRVLAQRLKNW